VHEKIIKMLSASDRVCEVLSYNTGHPIPYQCPETMSYRPLARLDPARLPDVVESLAREDVVVTSNDNNNKSGTTSNITAAPLTKRQEHAADVLVGLLYLAGGGLDEAHDIVLPYSWDAPTEQGGNPVLLSPAREESVYGHAMVHRLEGRHLGELGMTGYSNACFWFGRAGEHPRKEELVGEAGRIAREVGVAEVAEVSSVVRDWTSDKFIRLCREARDEGVREFCTRVTNVEWRLIVEHCNRLVNR